MKILNLLFLAGLLLAVPVLYAPDLLASDKHKNQDDPVNIGLLISDNKSIAARHGAEMAINKANEKGGVDGRPFRLVVRSMEGPWGNGSKEAVNLIFEDEVLAIMGSHDGRNAHLAEQACTKARVLFLSAWTSDPTLAQAFVPWYFSCVPNDNQQADALIEEIYINRNITRVAAISDEGYDGKMSFNSFIKKTKMAGKAAPIFLTFNLSAEDLNKLTDQIKKENADCIVFFGKASMAGKLIQLMMQNKSELPFFGPLALLDEEESEDNNLKNLENVTLVSSGHWLTSTGLEFRLEFGKLFGYAPGAVSAYAYDGMNLIIEAIKDAGPDREKLYKSMAKIHHEGVTGTIQFDDKGNRMGSARLMKIKNGIPVAIEK